MLLISTITFLILTIWGTDAKYAKTLLREHDRCQFNSNISGKCELLENCQRLQNYMTDTFKLSDVLKCGFINFRANSIMYCCPDEPLTPTTLTQVTSTGQPYYNFGKHLATLRYLNSVTLDDYVYRCTGIVLTPDFVLATSKCVGKDIIWKPNSVLLGSGDPRLYEESEIDIEIKKTILYKNDLAIFKLANNITASQLLGDVSRAKLCYEEDLLGEPTIVAVAYAYNPTEDSNCALFNQHLRLLYFNECLNVIKNREVEGGLTDKSHLCVAPVMESLYYRQRDNCTKCLTASSSVLHVKRRDGSECVAGIATPTTDECIDNGGPVYYTKIIHDSVSDFFIRNIIQEQ